MSKHYNMKFVQEVVVKFHSFLTMALLNVRC